MCVVLRAQSGLVCYRAHVCCRVSILVRRRDWGIRRAREIEGKWEGERARQSGRERDQERERACGDSTLADDTDFCSKEIEKDIHTYIQTYEYTYKHMHYTNTLIHHTHEYLYRCIHVMRYWRVTVIAGCKGANAYATHTCTYAYIHTYIHTCDELLISGYNCWSQGSS